MTGSGLERLSVDARLPNEVLVDSTLLSQGSDIVFCVSKCVYITCGDEENRAHMLMFFLAFVFGSLCTCCFHTLMRMFGNKCVLFPKFVSHPSVRLIVYEYFSIKMEKDEDETDQLPDYISTQWSDNSVCYIPTYVPLMSGLGGLVWATMFLMCSGSSTTGAQSHWRALPFMFVFSVAMSGLCIYSSVVTHSGLQELCTKLAEITGQSASPYTINVVTLAYERRIRGLYQATRLTISSAWLHTACWVLSALLVAARVLLAVDFTLVTIKAQLIGDVDAMLQKYEDQINSISPKTSFRIDEEDSEVELYATTNITKGHKSRIQFQETDGDTKGTRAGSEFALVPEERQKLRYDFIHTLVNDLVDKIVLDTTETLLELSPDKAKSKMYEDMNKSELDEITKKVILQLSGKLTKGLNEFEHQIKSTIKKKVVSRSSDGKHISDKSIDKEALEKRSEKNEENDGDKSKEKDKTSEMSIHTPSDSELTITPSYIKLTDNKKYTDEIKNTENKDIDETPRTDENIRDTDSVRTLTPFDNEIAKEYKQTAPNEKKLEKEDDHNESDDITEVDTVPHISDDGSDTKTTPENENKDKGQKKTKKDVND